MKRSVVFLFLLLLSFVSVAQPAGVNYDESKVPPYTLPDPLKFNDGSPVRNKSDWDKRRKELLLTFRKEVFGFNPEWKGDAKYTVVSQKSDLFGGIANRKEINIELTYKGLKTSMIVLIYLPKNSKNAPLFLSYNFYGNHTTSSDPDIQIPDLWVSGYKEIRPPTDKAIKDERGSDSFRWPFKEIVSRGFGIATVYYGDIYPDYDHGFKNCIHPFFDVKRDSASWGSIATWAWGLSLIQDYLETDKDINSKRVMVIGHSRLGKTALWAGANDKRFAMVISNNSGRGGAALWKRTFGATIDMVYSTCPYWYCDNFNKYSNKEELLPVDQHELIALIAPRPVYVASASEDLWADPKGEFLGCVYATPVYQLLGRKGLPVTEMPALNSPVFGDLSYHIRKGPHEITLYDWNCYMDFAEQYFKTSR